MATAEQIALWANRFELECLKLAGTDVDVGLAAATHVRSALPYLSSEEIDTFLSQNQFPDETVIDKPGDEPEEDWREEAEEIGTNDGKPVDKLFAYDIHNKKAQGVLNRTLEVSKKLSASAKEELKASLRKGKENSGEAILKFVDKYRLQLAKLLTATQLASLLEGAREIATKIPALANFPGAVPPPPTLEPKKAVELVERISKMAVEERAAEVYNLPSEQQTYLRQALAAQDAGGAPPSFTPPAPPTDSPEEIHFPTIDQAVKLLLEKNVITKDRFEALSASARAKAFTVANVEAEETLTKIRDSLAENIKEGVDYEEWSKKVMEDVGQGTFMSDAHQETVYRTNVQTQFSDGQMAVLEQPLVRSGFPYARQDAIHDDRVEDTHLEVEKIGIQGTNIFRINDPVFQTFRAPWRWNCRCGWTPITVRQASEAGIVEAQEWLNSGVEPSPPEFVSMPDFQPPPEFRRAVSSAPLSIQLSMQSLLTFTIDKEETKKPTLVAEVEEFEGGGPITTGALDTASEPPAGKRVTRVGRRLTNKVNKKAKTRSLFKKLRVKKKWNPSVALATDTLGHHHKGKGHQGGGQFTSPGIEEGDTGNGPTTKQPRPSRADQGGGGASRQDRSGESPGADPTAEKTGGGKESGTTPSFAETRDLLNKLGVGQVPEDENGLPSRNSADYDKHNEEVLAAAKELGLLVERDTFNKVTGGRNFGEYTGEHNVYQDADNNRFYKFTKNGFFGLSKDIYQYLWRIETANQLFPVLGYVFHGIVEGVEEGDSLPGDEKTFPQIVTSMNAFSGTHPTDQKKVENWFINNGWKPYGPAYNNRGKIEQLDWQDTKSGLIIGDAHTGNFIETAEGELVPIDVDIKHPNSAVDLNAPTAVPMSLEGNTVGLTVALPEKISVTRDWDKLRAVVVGRLNNDVLPAWYPSFTEPDGNEVAGPETAGQTKEQFNKEMYDRAITQTEDLCSILEREGVQVFRLPLISPEVAQEDPVGLSAEWPRELLTVIGNKLIINQPRAAHRNKEPRALESFLSELERSGKASVLRLPVCDWKKRDDNLIAEQRPFLEGGDVYRLGKDVIVTMSHLATSTSGFRWLSDQLASDGIEVWPAYLTEEWEHGDYVFFPVREGLCIAYLGAFVDGLLPSPITDWDVIALTKQEANSKFAANGLVLGENRILLPKGCPRVVRALERKGVDVIEVPFDGPMYWQGGIDCATTELWRDGGDVDYKALMLPISLAIEEDNTVTLTQEESQSLTKLVDLLGKVMTKLVDQPAPNITVNVPPAQITVNVPKNGTKRIVRDITGRITHVEEE